MYKGKADPLVCGSYRANKLLEQPMKVLERVLEKRIRCQLITCSLASCLEREPLMPFSFSTSLDGGDCLIGGHYTDDLAANSMLPNNH